MSSQRDTSHEVFADRGAPAGRRSPVPPPTPSPAAPPRPSFPPASAGDPMRWERRYAALVAAGDVLVVVTVASVFALGGLQRLPEAAARAHLVAGVVAGGLALVALPMFRAWEPRSLGQGVTEFVRLGRAITAAVVVLGLGGLFLMVESVRIWVFVLLPGTGLLCLLSRFTLRKWLHLQRVHGRCVLPVLAVGDQDAVTDLVRRTRRDPYFGWQVAAVCTPTGAGTDGGPDVAGVPVIGDLDAVPRTTRGADYRVVAVCRAPGWGPARLHRLAWELEGTDAELAVDPGLMEIAGPRMHIAPVDGLPLLRLSRPRFTGLARVLKLVLDRTVAATLLVLTAPVLLTIAAVVRLDDGGPVLFRQERVGANGRTFRMVKFRSMAVDAEARLAALSSENDGAGPLFKMRRDPRITRVGRLLRKYSLDELPQLFNVLGGTMSLVGPRPPLPSEVSTYADDARRRLLVRPGMTGLWQVSGRSSLSWEESVRLDLRYVENWSMALDLVIIWKTFGAVAGGRGAF